MALQYKTEHRVEVFNGMLTEVKDLREVPDGYSPDQSNWLTLTNKRGIELRRGSHLLGATKQTDEGGITGLGVGERFDGVEVPFFSHGRKVKYYDQDADDTVEVGTNLLPSDADGEGVSIFPYQNIAGSFVYLSSPNSSIYKIPTANPGSAVDQSSNNYRGFFKFGQARGFLFNRNGDTAGNEDKTSLYASKVDKVDLSQYPSQVTGESVGTGDAVEVTFTHTLVQRTGARTVMFATVTDGTETFVDDRNGNLVGNLGGTGTINYATGAISVTFNTAPANLQAITASYYYEDATSGGICDFSIADTSNRQPGEGNIFPQFDGGGNLNSVFPLATVFYCFHAKKTWQVSIPVDDESGTDSISTNLPFRERMGVKSNYGANAGEHGIYFVNTADENKPEFMRLEFLEGATEANIAAPKTLSELMDFSPHAFDEAVVFDWEDYVLLACQRVRNGVADAFNSLLYVLNKKNGAWDRTDIPASRLAAWGGGLLAGDPITDNVFTIFSGFDDDENIIANHWTSGLSDLEMQGTKRFTRFVVEGLIQKSQRFKVQFSFDGGDWVDGETIDGAGDYVDTATSVSVGSHTVGSKIGGGGATVTANPYRYEFRVQSPRFNYVRVRFEACVTDDDGQEGGGYVSIHSYSYKDIRQKGLRSMPVRTQV